MTKSREIDPSGEGLLISSSSIELASDKLPAADAVRAIVYTIGKIVNGDAIESIKNLTHIYENMLSDVSGKIKAFRNVIATGRFEVAFQPIVGMKNKDIHHYEALVRFSDHHATKSPYEMIRFAEDLELISEFDYAMFLRICDIISEHGDEIPPIAINVSAASLADKEFVEKLREYLSNKSDIAEKIILEITETVSVKCFDEANKNLNILRDLVLSVCLDDFGVGATNLDYLRQFGIDYVKIDGTYIQRLDTSKEAKVFLRSIVDLCRNLNIRTIAEFVENENTLKILQDSQVDYGQGFFFGRPQLKLPTNTTKELHSV